MFVREPFTVFFSILVRNSRFARMNRGMNRRQMEDVRINTLPCGRKIIVVIVIFPRMKVFDTFGAKVIKWGGGHYKVILGLKIGK